MASAIRRPSGALAVRGLWRALRRAAAGELAGGADLVHAHWWVPSGWSVAPGAPFVLTCHGTDVALLGRSRIARAIARPDDVVLLSGWSRTGRSDSEAEIMAQAWRGAAARVLLDRGARTTTGNAIGIGRVARSVGAAEVVVVTSSWHGCRARALARAALAGTGIRVDLVTTGERAATPQHEEACPGEPVRLEHVHVALAA
jgi:hypothetical protein